MRTNWYCHRTVLCVMGHCFGGCDVTISEKYWLTPSFFQIFRPQTTDTFNQLHKLGKYVLSANSSCRFVKNGFIRKKRWKKKKSFVKENRKGLKMQQKSQYEIFCQSCTIFNTKTRVVEGTVISSVVCFARVDV